MNTVETIDSLQNIIDYVNSPNVKTAMVLSHDANFAIAKDNGLIHRDRADMRWFKRLTSNHVCVVGSVTHFEVKDLPDRIWLRLSRSRFHRDGYNSDKLSTGITFSKEIAKSKHMLPTVIIAGGAQIYNEAIEKDLADVIVATVWNADLGGDKTITDYTLNRRYRLHMTAPLDVVGDVPADVRLYVRA